MKLLRPRPRRYECVIRAGWHRVLVSPCEP